MIFSKLGQVADEIGWKKKNLIERLNDSKKKKSKFYYKEKVKKIKNKIINSIQNKNLEILYVKY